MNAVPLLRLSSYVFVFLLLKAWLGGWIAVVPTVVICEVSSFLTLRLAYALFLDRVMAVRIPGHRVSLWGLLFCIAVHASLAGGTANVYSDSRAWFIGGVIGGAAVGLVGFLRTADKILAMSGDSYPDMRYRVMKHGFWKWVRYYSSRYRRQRQRIWNRGVRELGFVNAHTLGICHCSPTSVSHAEAVDHARRAGELFQQVLDLPAPNQEMHDDTVRLSAAMITWLVIALNHLGEDREAAEVGRRMVEINREVGERTDIYSASITGLLDNVAHILFRADAPVSEQIEFAELRLSIYVERSDDPWLAPTMTDPHWKQLAASDLDALRTWSEGGRRPRHLYLEDI
ncbi:hypothetical protein ACWCW7_08730 [Nocardia tengchongensis]